MERPSGGPRYRISGIRPWASEGTDEAPQEVQTFFTGKEVDVADLEALAVSFGGQLENVVQGGGRAQGELAWRGHRFNLDLDPLP